MRLRRAALVLIATAMSCGAGNLGGGGTAGTSATGEAGGSGGSVGAGGSVGTGGTGGGAGVGGTAGSGPSCETDLGTRASSGTTGAGTGGVLGTGGSSSPYPSCRDVAPSGPPAGGSITDACGTSLQTSVAATVTVSAFDRAQARLTDVASGQQWTWSLAIPNLPANRINVSERYDLIVEARPCPYPAFGACQTVVLERDGALVAFTADLRSSLRVVPSLTPWGIAVADAGVFCELPGGTTPISCPPATIGRARVTIGSQTATLVPRETVMLEGVSISLGTYDSPIIGNGCDGAGHTLMAGFRLP